MWFSKKKRAEVTGELPIQFTPAYTKPERPDVLKRVNKAFWAHIGMVRQNNEDSFLYKEELFFTNNESHYVSIAVIADGMGGLDLGEEASSGAVQMFEELTKTHFLPLLNKKEPTHLELIESTLVKIVKEINGNLYEYFLSKGGRSGSTLSAMILFEDHAHIAHVGDSRIYMLDLYNKQIKQITSDHSYVSRLVEMGQLTPEEAKTHPRKNEIYKMLAFENSVEPDYIDLKLEPNQYFLLCSDGLTDMIQDEEILQYALEGDSLQEVVDRLGHLANQRGGYDNCTILYLEPIF